MNIRSNKRGVVLISVVVIILTMALIGASLIAFYTSVNLTARQATDDSKAFYLAEAGISYAIHQMREHAHTNAVKPMDEIMGPVSLG